MMRKQRLVYGLMLLASLNFFTGCKEEEVEKKVENTQRVDALRKELRELELEVIGSQKTLDSEKLSGTELEKAIAELKENYNKVVAYTVTVVDLQGKLLGDVKVITNQGGVITEQTTNSEGRVTFADMRGGVVNVVVKHDNYATANYTSSLYASTYNYKSYGATTRVLMFPLAGALNAENMTTYKMRLFYNGSVQDDTLGGSAPDRNADAAKWAPRQFSWTNQKFDQVTKGDNVPVVAKLEIDEIPTGSGSGGIGNIIAISYENAVYNGVWGDDNYLTISVPARSVYDDWFEFNTVFGDFKKSVVMNVNGASPMAKPSNYPKTYTEERTFRMTEELDSDMPGTVYQNGMDYIYWDSYKF